MGGNRDYLQVVYDEKAKPRTGYPRDLAVHLARRFGLRPGGRLLDVGCGRGEMLEAFASLGLSCRGLDLAQSASCQAPGVEVACCDVTQGAFPHEDGAFDAVFCKSVIEHVQDPTAMLAEMLRVLRPGGVALILTPDFATSCRVFYEDPTHVHPYVPKALHALLTWRGFVRAGAERFCHHPLVWDSPLAAGLARVMQAVVPVEAARWLTERTGCKFFRWAVERQVLASGYKE